MCLRHVKRALCTTRRVIDMRSDTVTRPTPLMRRVMFEAEVGDDVYGEDPSCILLEKTGAQLTGKQACVFVCSGSLGNLASFMAHCDRRGGEVILGDRQHTYVHEQGGAATLAGIHSRVISNEEDGTLDIDAVRNAIQSDDPHYAQTMLVSVENTHNGCGGVPLSLNYLHELKSVLSPSNIPLHMDGARAGNAAVALGVDLRQVCASVDSVSLCLSKGLGAPVGSLVAGDEEFIRRVRRAKKVLGGGWRQAGILARAGLVALESMTETLQRDHKLAGSFASALASLEGVELEKPPATNLVFFRLAGGRSAVEFSSKARARGLLVGGGYGRSGDEVRAVFHLDVTEDDAERALEVIRDVLKQW